MKRLILLFAFSLAVTAQAQDAPQVKITLTTGEVITAPKVWDDTLHVWFVKDGKTIILDRSEVRAIERPVPPPPCPIKLEAAPEIRGFKLGMDYKTVKARFKDSTLFRFGERSRIDELNFQSVGVNRYMAGTENLELLGGLEQIDFRFLDGQLVYLSLTYDASVDWDSVEQFTKKIGGALNLPDAWESDEPQQKLICDGFTVNAKLLGGRPTLTFEEGSYRKKIATRRAEQEKNKRDSFKP